MRWDPTNGKSITVIRAVLNGWYLKNNEEFNDSISDDVSDDSSTSRNINPKIASSDDRNDSENCGKYTEEDDNTDKENISNIEMTLTVKNNTRPTVSQCYGQQLLKVTLCGILDCPMNKQPYKEAIGYAIIYIYDRFERLHLDGRPVEVKLQTGNESLDVQRLHNYLLYYDHDYNPDYRKLTDMKNTKHMCNILGDPNNFQVTD